MISYGVPETMTAEYPATTPGIPISTGFTTTTSSQIVQDPLGGVITSSAFPTNNYEIGSMVPTTTYQVGTYQPGDLNYENIYQTVSAPLTTSYQEIANPVSTINYVSVPSTSYIPVSLANVQPLMSIAPQQSFVTPQTMMPVSQSMSMPVQQADSHFVRNYPIYENDPRRIAMNPGRASQLEALIKGSYGYGATPGLGLTTAGGNLDDFALRSRALGLNGLNSSGLNTGLGGLNSGLNTGLGGLNTGLGGLNSSSNNGLGLGGLSNSINQLGTGLNGLGSTLNNTGLSKVGSGLNNLSSGLNSVNNLTSGSNGLNNLSTAANGLNNLTSGTEGLNSNLESNGIGLADKVNNFNDGLAESTNLADNLRSGGDTGLSNFANNVGEATNDLVNNTSKGIDELGNNL